MRILTVADRHADYAYKLRDSWKKLGFHVDVDDASESVSKKIRNAQLAQINYILTIGDLEQEHETVNLRTRDNVVHGEIKVDEFLKIVEREKKERLLETPFKKE